MKKKVTVILLILVLFLILFAPLPPIAYRDGGTREYKALTYKIVVWNRLIDESENGVYHKTSVYFFPENLKSIDELWEREYARSAK